MDKLSLTDVMVKPQGCGSCGYRFLCQGFLPDHVPANPKLAFLAEAGGDTEMLERAPLVGATGRMFFHSLLHPHGLTRDDVILANVIKGHPPNNEYPTGQLRKNAERSCRQFDGVQRVQHDSYVETVPGGINAFDPNMALVTVHPSFVSRTWSILRVAQADIQKAIRLMERGYRVVVLLGDKATSLVLPDLEGGILKWRGHFQEINWSDVQKRAQQ